LKFVQHAVCTACIPDDTDTQSILQSVILSAAAHLLYRGMREPQLPVFTVQHLYPSLSVHS